MAATAQTSLFAERARVPDTCDCAVCAVAYQPVLSAGGETIGWRCPICGDARKFPPMPPLSMRGACPVCLGDFWVLPVHLGKTKCGAHYAAGLVWDRNRPAWARYSEHAR